MGDALAPRTSYRENSDEKHATLSSTSSFTPAFTRHYERPTGGSGAFTSMAGLLLPLDELGRELRAFVAGHCQVPVLRCLVVVHAVAPASVDHLHGVDRADPTVELIASAIAELEGCAALSCRHLLPRFCRSAEASVTTHVTVRAGACRDRSARTGPARRSRRLS